MSACLENVLCPAKQAKAVLNLILEESDNLIDNDTVLNALFSVQNEVNRIIDEVHELLDKNDRLAKKLLAMGVYEEVMQSVKDSEASA